MSLWRSSARVLASLLACLVSGVLSSVTARAERGLVAPRAEAPLSLAPGETLPLIVQTATGLTPPPGLQEPRAHRGFAARLCADGFALGAPSRQCFPLLVRDVRPLDSHSLSYRISMVLPHWVAPWAYDLEVRFPGGSDEARAAVIVGGGQSAPGILEGTDGALLLRPSGALSEASARIHLGPGRGLSAQGAELFYYPLPDEAGAFGDGSVAIVRVRRGPVQLSATRHDGRASLALDVPRAQAGVPVWLEVRDLPPAAQVFWWLGVGESARGPRVSARFVDKRPQRVSALVLEPDGRATRLDAEVELSPREVGGCALGEGAWGETPVAGLLLLALSRKLGARRRRAPQVARRE